MKKVIALGLATAFSFMVQADQQNWTGTKTFLRFETPFQSASPERLSLFNEDDLRDRTKKGHGGDMQFTIFGGQNSDRKNAAAYYMPNGLETITFNASFNDQNGGTATNSTLWYGSQGGTETRPATLGQVVGYADYAMGASTGASSTGATEFTMLNTTDSLAATNLAFNTAGVVGIINDSSIDAANTFVVGTGVTNEYAAFDLTTLRGLIGGSDEFPVAIGDFVVDTNKNAGVIRPWNFGVGYAPNVQMGYNVSQSEFVSTIAPELKRSHWGIGFAWRQLLSDSNTGFFVELATALQRVTMNMELNEEVLNELVLNAASNDETDGAIFLDSWTDKGFNAGNEVAPTNMTEAFAQAAWMYGRIDGEQSITRLADIELKLGYQFICEENILASSFVGMVIPTGNKATGEFMAEPVVGNGFHFGLMSGSTAEIQLNSESDTRWAMRTDANFRYLFENTQVRSFDTKSNGQWSRYMMVWENYAQEQANGELLTEADSLRAYTPGINVFTREMNVTPRAQFRLNQALVLERGGFKGELGWNMLGRQAEEVSLVDAWVDNAVAFVDASNNGTSLYNVTRTIFNDSYQSTPTANGGLGGTGIADASQTQYNLMSVSADDLDLNSAASPAVYTNTPYLALGYAFNEEKSTMFSLGVSYEMAATNGYINNWTLWGKFGFAF
jgi:hypothetical protein